jgi:nitroimidazol reductase NimA-like FMN-containing flavoprotein (pyridoxamine 5'-phosphate oxidase superfamily)
MTSGYVVRMRHNDVQRLLDDDPIAQGLLTSAIPARLAYIGLDGAPRVIPIGFLYKDARIEVFTLPGSAKVAALRANPAVALTVDTESQPPHVLMVRGTAALEEVDGVPDDYLAAARKVFAPEQFVAWEKGVRALYDRMVRISIAPTWAKVLDFETRAPAAVERLAREKGLMK